MRQSLPSKYIFQLLVTIAWLSLGSSVSAQPSQALIENWRAPDYNFNSTMLDNDLDGNVYVVGDTQRPTSWLSRNSVSPETCCGRPHMIRWTRYAVPG